MQTPTTLTRDKGFNRLTAGAIGLALLAAATIGAITLNDQVDLPLTGSDSQAQPVLVAHGAPAQGEGKLDNTNVIADYAATNPVIRYTAIYAGEGLIEQNSFDYEIAETTTVEAIQTLEANSWDYPVRARVAGEAAQPAAGTVDEMRFIEDNTINLPNATAQGEIVPNTPS